MDLETENRIAAILLKEAAELRRQAEREGFQVYLQQPKARGRPNSRFLTATVLGVQQANRAVEVNEMWRLRQKELELDHRLKGRSEDDSSRRSHRDTGNSSRNSRKRHTVDDDSATASCSSSKRVHEDSYSGEDKGLGDEELEEFLKSRIKRGRGAVGSRMDETGPYLAPSPDSNEKVAAGSDVWQHRIFCADKPSSLKSFESSDEETHESRRKKSKERSGSLSKHSRKHRSKEMGRHKKKKKKREEKRSKHHK